MASNTLLSANVALAKADRALNKAGFKSEESRDAHGRWSGGGGSSARPKPNGRYSLYIRDKTDPEGNDVIAENVSHARAASKVTSQSKQLRSVDAENMAYETKHGRTATVGGHTYNTHSTSPGDWKNVEYYLHDDNSKEAFKWNHGRGKFEPTSNSPMTWLHRGRAALFGRVTRPYVEKDPRQFAPRVVGKD